MALTNEDLQAISQLFQSVSQPIKDDLDTLKKKTTDLALHLENVTDRNIELLAENHLSLVDKLNEAVKTADKTALYEIQVRILTEKVDKLSNEVANLKGQIA
ncbi:MAG: hypothetical protein HFG78_04315 [Hungatella sp.]|jgi:hypothetical protein|nr:hypothetical protein [Hungatella sp.]MCI9500443.1 hypothetical protein [Hungatella sp.]